MTQPGAKAPGLPLAVASKVDLVFPSAACMVAWTIRACEDP
jgi:hypothetical protein